MSFRINVIFHKFLVPEAYETLSSEDIAAYVRFVAVNAKIPKEIPSTLAPYVIHERELPWYDPFMQYNRFCESSVFFHAYRNPEKFLDRPYIGFLHYDMLLKKEALEFLEREIADEAEILFTQSTLVARPHLEQIISLAQWDQLVQLYNVIFRKSHTIQSVLDKEIPLYHSFVIHRTTFGRMMFFAERVVPYLFEMLAFSTEHLPFMLERLYGVFLALEKENGLNWRPIPGIIHVDRLKDAWRGAL
jgi:hypothetical protein